jgi:hypothetical protein
MTNPKTPDTPNNITSTVDNSSILIAPAFQRELSTTFLPTLVSQKESLSIFYRLKLKMDS